MSDLVLGPLVRYVDTTRACVWVETAASAEVTVVAGEHRFTARTFAVHGHHYALLEIDGLGEGTHTPYSVEVDGTNVWPPADTSYPVAAMPRGVNSNPWMKSLYGCPETLATMRPSRA